MDGDESPPLGTYVGAIGKLDGSVRLVDSFVSGNVVNADETVTADCSIHESILSNILLTQYWYSHCWHWVKFVISLA